MVETLKASGHQVSLVINAGSSTGETDHAPPLDDLPNGNQVDIGEDSSELKPDVSLDESCDSRRVLARHNTDTSITSNSQSTDGMSSSQDTLDDIVESPVSFEGDTDFSGMEKVLMKSKVVDLHRTSSAPLTHRERAVVMEASTESGTSSSGGGRGESKGSMGSAETASLDHLDGASRESGSMTGSENMSYESRLQMRTSSDGTVSGKTKKKVSWKIVTQQEMEPQ